MKKGFTAGILTAFILAAGGLGYATTHLGAPVLTEDARDIVNTTIDTRTVDFYRSVCKVVSPVTNDATDVVLQAGEDSVGVEDADSIFVDAQGKLAEVYLWAAASLPDEAPADVFDPTQRSLRSYDPLLQRVRARLDDAGGHISAAGNTFADTQKAAEAVADMVTRDVSSLGTLAPLTSEATHAEVKKIPECGEFFAEADTSVHGDVVAAYVAVERATNLVNDSVREGMPVEEAVEAAVAALDRAVADTAHTPVAETFVAARRAAEPKDEDAIRAAMVEVNKAQFRLRRQMSIPNAETSDAIARELDK